MKINGIPIKPFRNIRSHCVRVAYVLKYNLDHLMFISLQGIPSNRKHYFSQVSYQTEIENYDVSY